MIFSKVQADLHRQELTSIQSLWVAQDSLAV
jgi:hypothetical protein